jgi:hypothetical protein
MPCRYRFQIYHPDFPPSQDLSSGDILIPFVPGPFAPSAVIGKVARELTVAAGTYGMGGPGFVGLDLADCWLIIAIWGAGSFFLLDGRFLTDMDWQEADRPPPWSIEPYSTFRHLLTGCRLEAAEVTAKSIAFRFDGDRTLGMSTDLSLGGLPDSLSKLISDPTKDPLDDLRDVVFLAPTSVLWI